MNKLGFYVEVTNTPGLEDAIREVKPRTLLTHANDKSILQKMRRHLSPDTFVVGRLHKDPHVQDALLDSGDPEGKAREFAEEILSLNNGDMARERGDNGRLLIDAWMSLNECVAGPASDAYRGTEEDDEADVQKRRKELEARYKAYDLFMVAFRNRLKEEDGKLEAVAFNFGAGNFQTATSYLDWFPDTLKSHKYLGFHEYGWPALSKHLHPDTKSAAGQYRGCMKGIQTEYDTDFEVIITEAGLARLYKYDTCHEDLKGKCDVGWLYKYGPISEEDYWASLDWYNRMLCEDDYVLGACLFEVGHAGDWVTFRHLGEDNEGKPLGIINKIKDLRDS